MIYFKFSFKKQIEILKNLIMKILFCNSLIFDLIINSGQVLYFVMQCAINNSASQDRFFVWFNNER